MYKATSLICLIILVLPASDCLKCYQCVSLETQQIESNTFRDRVKYFALERLADVYHFTGKVTECPDISVRREWEDLEIESKPCQISTGSQSWCTLGRFKVITWISDSKQNITSYGTILGCANRRLINYAKGATKHSKCSYTTAKSAFKMSLSHFLEVEHCATPDNMCNRKDFCISPRNSVVKIFQDDIKHTDTWHILTFLIVGILLGLFVAVMTLVGIKYDSGKFKGTPVATEEI